MIINVVFKIRFIDCLFIAEIHIIRYAVPCAARQVYVVCPVCAVRPVCATPPVCAARPVCAVRPVHMLLFDLKLLHLAPGAVALFAAYSLVSSDFCIIGLFLCKLFKCMTF